MCGECSMDAIHSLFLSLSLLLSLLVCLLALFSGNHIYKLFSWAVFYKCLEMYWNSSLPKDIPSVGLLKIVVKSAF